MDFDLVEDGLYLGSRRGLQDFLLSNSNSTVQVLTVESENLSQLPHCVSDHMFVQVDDVKTADLLSHFDNCLSFIQTGLQKGAVYVHCRHGVSRSATVCAAFLMTRHGITADEAIERVRRCRPCVSPNAGFRRQLELFERLGCRIVQDEPEFRRYRLRAAAHAVADDVTCLPELSEPLLRPDTGLSGCSGDGPPPSVYRCGQCRSALFSDRSVIHCQQDETGVNEGSLRLLPLPWMSPARRMPSGRLTCPRCSRKLGSFTWLPESGHWPDEDFEPSFLITRSRVDHCPPRLAVPAAVPQRHLTDKARTTAVSVDR